MYNLNKETQARLENEFLLCVLSAGYARPYGQGGKAIFVGHVDRQNGIHIRRNKADITTTIECGDAEKEITRAITQISLKGRVELETVLDRLLRDMGIAIAYRDRLPRFVFENGYSNSGSTKKILDDVGKKAGFRWSVLNYQLRILEGANTTEQSGQRISKDSGLIGAVTKSKEKIEFGTLINPDIVPDAKAVVVSERFGDLVVRITRVRYAGDNWEGDWVQEVEAIPL